MDNIHARSARAREGAERLVMSILRFTEVYQKLLAEQTAEREALNIKQAVERAKLKAEIVKAGAEEREALNAKQAVERKKPREGKLYLKRLAEYESGRWVLYHRPWGDRNGWKNLCLSQMQGPKRKRVFTFGWNGVRLSQREDSRVLELHYPLVWEWLRKECDNL